MGAESWGDGGLANGEEEKENDSEACVSSQASRVSVGARLEQLEDWAQEEVEGPWSGYVIYHTIIFSSFPNQPLSLRVYSLTS